MPSHADTQATLKRVDRLAYILDTRFRLPGTPIRFGLDPIISILPVAGDTVSAAIGLYIVREAIRHRVRPSIIARMLRNIGINWLLGLIPLIGIIPDALYKSNMKNAVLLRRVLIERLGGSGTTMD